MTEHTKEPWFCEGDSVYNNSDCVGNPIAHVLSCAYDNDLNNMDARRIVACVNACAGIPTEKLEGRTIAEYVSNEAYLQGMHHTGEGMNVGLSGLACQMLAASFAGQFVGSDAVNYLEVHMEHPEIGDFNVTIQRKEGKTPGQMKYEVEQQREKLQEVCAEAYQFAGAYDAPVEVLDNLHAAANGLPIPHESFLPVDDSELVKQRDQLLEAMRQILDANDLEMQDGDFARDVAKAAIAAVKGE